MAYIVLATFLAASAGLALPTEEWGSWNADPNDSGEAWGSWETTIASSSSASSSLSMGGYVSTLTVSATATTTVTAYPISAACAAQDSGSSTTVTAAVDGSWPAWSVDPEVTVAYPETSPSSTSADWRSQSAFFSQSAPTATLVPAVHWGINTADLGNLIPSDGTPVYYSTEGTSNPDVAHQMAWLTVYASLPSVVLDHSQYITYQYSPTSQTLTIYFKSIPAYKKAHTSWGLNGGVTFIANSAGCATDGGSCYFQASSIVWNADAWYCTVSGTPSSLEDVLVNAEVEWGNHMPSKNPYSIYSSTSTGSLSASASSYSPTGTPLAAATSGASQTSQTSPLYGSTTAASLSSTSTATAASSGNSSSYTTSNTTSSASTPSGSLTSDYLSSANATANCTAPADTKYGLPTACLGKTFDSDLDDNFGYVTLSQTDFAEFTTSFTQLEYPDPTADDATDDTEDNTDDTDFDLSDVPFNYTRLARRARRNVFRRSCGVWHPLDCVKAVAQTVAQALPPIPYITKPMPVDLLSKSMAMEVPKDRTLVASPWGQQVLIKSFAKTTKADTGSAKLDIYCVDCGAKGSANIAGRALFSLATGIDSLQASFDGDLSVILKVGIDASITYNNTFSQQLFQVGIPGFCLSGAVCVGPYLKVGADCTINAAANGQLLAGAEFTIQHAQSTVDFFDNSKSSSSGWQPEFKPVFQANGSIQISADVGLPIAIAVGVNVLDGKYKKEMAIIDRPSIVATAQVAASIGLSSGNSLTGGFTDSNGCTGISTQIGFKNKLWVDVLGLTSFTLSDPPLKNLAQGCIALPAAADSSSSPGGSSATATGESPSPTATDGSSVDGSSGPTPTTTGGTNEQATATAAATDGSSVDGNSASTPITTGGTNEQATATAAATGGSSVNGNSGSTGDGPTDAEAAPTPSSDGTTTALRFMARQDPSTSAQGGSPTTTSSDDSPTNTDTAANSATSSSTSAGAVTDDTGADNTAGTADDSDDYSLDSVPDTGYNMTDGYEVASMIDVSSTYQVLACSNGNLYLFGINDTIPSYQCAEMWYASVDNDDTIITDGMNRLPHYYPNTMNVTGVSRVRVTDAENIPQGAEYVAFMPLDAGTDSDSNGKADGSAKYYFAVDQSGTIFYPIICVYPDQPTKLFLANDPTQGPVTLMSSNLEYSVTGGTPSQCAYLPLIQG